MEEVKCPVVLKSEVWKFGCEEVWRENLTTRQRNADNSYNH